MDLIPKQVVPDREVRSELVVHKSRFIATLSPCSSVEAARQFIERVRSEFPDASHHVTAWLIGHGNSQEAHCSDAGEPSGSAGRPVLAVLRGSGLGDVAAVVTRYFGGTKLGVGGLVHAYGDVTRQALQILPRANKVLAHKVRLGYTYPSVERVRRLVEANGGLMLEEVFSEQVEALIQLPVECLPGFERALADLTGGGASVEILGTELVKVPIPPKDR